ncbi:hypothetical protein ACFV4N_13865 [Actinosynnema sp. NPDC059797]
MGVPRWVWAVPLLFFGTASLLAVPLHRPGTGELELRVLAVLGTNEHLRSPTTVGLYWVGVLILGAFLGEWCCRRAAVPDVAPAAGPAALSAALGAVPLTTALAGLPRGWAGTGTGVILLALAVVLWRRDAGVGTILATGAGTAVLVWSHPVVGQFVVLGVGLFVLAAGVRDNALRTTVGAFAVAVCLSAAFTPVGVGSTWALASPVLLPGAVLLIGGAVGLRPAVRRGRVAVT